MSDRHKVICSFLDFLKAALHFPKVGLFVGFFALWHINLISHLMPTRVKENKSEKKFKAEILGINDKL